VPLCLPGISDQGFVYAYVYFYNKNIGIVMITTQTTSEMFFELSKISKSIQEELVTTKLMSSLANSLSLLPYTEEIASIKNLKHFIIQSISLNQYTMPKWNAYGDTSKELKAINKIYAYLYDKYLQSKPMKKENSHKLNRETEPIMPFMLIKNTVL